MSQVPACEMGAGRPHDDDPPAAVGQFRLRWTGDPAGGAPGPHESVKHMCQACYDGKVSEFTELARERGAGNCVEVITQYAGSRRLPLHAGACDRRAPGRGRQ